MVKEDIKKILPLIDNPHRFFKIQGEQYLWFYDSYTHGLYPIDSLVLESIKQTGAKYLEKLTIEENLRFLGFLKAIRDLPKDSTNLSIPDEKCSVMINISNRCNLDCSYCYRNKKHSNIMSLDVLKDSIDYVTKRYKPNASEFVFSYSMTSESSLDLEILEKIAEEYVNYEDYRFRESDFNEKLFHDFYLRLKETIGDNFSEEKFPKENAKDIVKFLNRILGKRNLFDSLNLSESMFRNNDRNEIRNRNILAKWRLFRLNRWCLELLFDKYIKRRKVPYVGFWFMTNGTCASERFISFIKSCDLNPLWISIDGPDSVHNANRIFNGGKGTYDEIVRNIQIFKKNHIRIKASVVITKAFPKPLEIIRHIQFLGFDEIVMTPVRPGCEQSFDNKTVEDLVIGYDEVFEELENNAIKKNFRLFSFLKNDMILAPFYSFLNRVKIYKRCSFDDQIVINSKGEIYPCLYFVDNKEFCYGNIKEGIDRRKLNHNIDVKNRFSCSDCWARYLCGGTCFYGAYNLTGNYLNVDLIECRIKKYLAEKNLKLIVFLQEHNISFQEILNA